MLPLGDLLASFLSKGTTVANDDQDSVTRTGQERSSGERADVPNGPSAPGQRPGPPQSADDAWAASGASGRDEDTARPGPRDSSGPPNPYGPPDDLGSANPYGSIRYDPLGRYGATGEFPAVDPYGLYGSFPAYGGGGENASADPPGGERAA